MANAARGYSGVLDAVQSPEIPRARCSQGVLDAVQSPKVPRARCSLGYLMQCRASIPRARCSLGYLMHCRVRKYPWQDAAWGYRGVLDAVQSPEIPRARCSQGVLDAVQSPKLPRARCSLGYLMQCGVRKYLGHGVLDAVQSPEIPRARCSLGYLMRCRVRKYLRVPLVAPNRIFTSSRSRHAVNRARLNNTQMHNIEKCPLLFLLYIFFFHSLFSCLSFLLSFFLNYTLALHH
jgi:hypothetical protein